MASTNSDPKLPHDHHDRHHQPHHRHHRPMAESIAVSTRSIHAKLNKLIITRLPLALPPRCADPSNYVSGLLHIAPIYITFESVWKSLLDESSSSNPEFKVSDSYDPGRPLLDLSIFSPENWNKKSEHQPNVCTRIDSLLQYLYIPELMRSYRLKADISSLTGWPDHVVEEQIRSVGQQACLGEFVRHIREAIDNKPHVLLAYSYVLFMALFAGGRFIRASLEAAGEEFWEQRPSPVKPSKLPTQYVVKPVERASGLADEEVKSDPCNAHAEHVVPLRFLHFKSLEDGEDLKRLFKQRLLDLERILTDSERHDIVQESVCIFERMLLLVQQLDEVCAEADQEDGGELSPIHPFAGMITPTSARCRDSVEVAKERVARSSKKSSSDESMCSATKHPAGARRTESGSSSEDPSDQSQSSHPHVMSPSDISLCPGLAKSMRFEKALPRPTRTPNNSVVSRTSLSDKIQDAPVTSWLLAAGFGAVFIGAFMSGRVA